MQKLILDKKITLPSFCANLSVAYHYEGLGMHEANIIS